MINSEKIEKIFRSNFEERSELGASLSVWKDGEEILSLHLGWRDRDETKAWTADTMVPVCSCTKGPAALTTLMALHEAGIGFDSKVESVWPELKAARGTGLTFAQLLSHQSGLAALSPGNKSTILSHSGVCKAFENQEPFWSPGDGHGYHPRTIGFLLDEVVRRVTDGTALGKFWNEKIAKPIGIDFRIGGLDASELDRTATVYPPRIQRPPKEEIPFYRALADSDSLSQAAFSSPGGMRALSDVNKLEYLQAGLPSLGGVGSARGLAKFYSLLAADGIHNDVRVLPKAVVDAARSTQTDGEDQVLLMPTAFTAGFMRDPIDADGEKKRQIFGSSKRAFGQPGAGGSHAFADPENGIAFAYTMNQMESGVLPNRKSLNLVDAIYESLGSHHS